MGRVALFSSIAKDVSSGVFVSFVCETGWIEAMEFCPSQQHYAVGPSGTLDRETSSERSELTSRSSNISQIHIFSVPVHPFAGFFPDG